MARAEGVDPRTTVAGDNETPHAAEAHDRVFQAAGDAVAAEGTVLEEGGAERRVGIIAWLFQAGEEPRQVSVEELPRLVTVEENLVWIDLSGFDEADLRLVADRVGVHDLAVSAAVAAWQRPRVDVLGDHFFASATIAELDAAAHRALARQLDLVVGHNYLISAHKQPLPFYRPLLTRASHDPNLVRLDSGFMLYIILDELLSYYETLAEQIRGEVEQMQERALRDSSDEFLEDMVHFKRYAFALTQLVEQHRSVFQAFLRPDFPFLGSGEVQARFRDLEAELLRLIDRLELTRQEVNNTFDIYVSHQSQRTNNVMKTLTMVATVLFTATFIEGIFGPSFQRVPTHSLPAFILMLAMIVLASGAALYAFHRRGWM